MKQNSRDDLVSVTAIVAGTVVSVVVTVLSMMMSDEETLSPTSSIDAVEISIEATEGGVFVDPNVHGRSRARLMRYEALGMLFEAEFEQRPIIQHIPLTCNAGSFQFRRFRDNLKAARELCAEYERSR